MEEATRAVPREKDNFRPDIEGLRGLAVLLVVFFHAGLLSNAPFQIPGGFIGVDLFFVVSGFLITGLLIRERERTGSISFSKFYARRVRRILPAAAVVLVVTILASGALVTLIARPETMTDGAAAALSIANVRFAITTDYFNPTSYSPFLHFWSLGVEEQFYLVWPALLFVVAWRRPRLGIGAALVSIIVVSFAANVYMTDSNPSWAFYMLPTRAWQLAGGGLLALFAGSTIKTPASFARLVSMALPIIGWTALMALLVGAFALNSNIAYPGVAAVLPTVAAMVLIASGGASRGPGMLLRRSPIRFLGKISYSLYLWHWPMLILGGLALSGATGQVSPTGEVQAMLTPVAALGLALASIPVATLSWAFIEEPFRRGTISLPIRHISFSLPRPSRTVVAGIGSMMLITVLCTSIGVSAQNSLDNLGSNTSQIDVADTSTPTDAPDPTDTLGTADAPPGDTTSDGTSDGTDPNASVINTIPDPTTDPTTDPTPTAVPAMTPALTNAPPVTPKSYAVTNALRPTLAHAANDFEATWHDGCLGNSTKSNIPAVGKCIYSNPGGTYSVVLIGDSHASALLPAVTGVAKAHGWKLTAYVKVDCKFVDISIYNEFLKRTYTECATWNARSSRGSRQTVPLTAAISFVGRL